MHIFSNWFKLTALLRSHVTCGAFAGMGWASVSIASWGTVQQWSSGTWRVITRVNGKLFCGPSRDLEAEAECDLASARLTVSREAFVDFLKNMSAEVARDGGTAVSAIPPSSPLSDATAAALPGRRV